MNLKKGSCCSIYLPKVTGRTKDQKNSLQIPNSVWRALFMYLYTRTLVIFLFLSSPQIFFPKSNYHKIYFDGMSA